MAEAPVALIPARGGSKRLPRKNIAPFFGRPMLAWTVDAARDSGVFARIVVSTDDDEIAAVAKAAGAEVLRRPLAVSDDKAGLIDVIQHAIAAEPRWPDTFCMLLANCPLRGAGDIAASAAAFGNGGPPALLSVVGYGWTPAFRALYEKDGALHFAFPEWAAAKAQEYPDVLCPSGAIYWARRAAVAGSDTLYVPGIAGFRMPWHRAIDIDTEEDLRLAACLKFSLDRGFDFGAPVQ